MKIRNPESRYQLNINKNHRVLEVGGGHNPNPRSNIIVDKFIDSNFHRKGDIKVLENQQFIQADGEQLPFKDKAFDYVISAQVLEHVEDPEKFLSEQVRVAKQGYIEVPSLIGEYLFPKKSHKWVILEIDKQLVIVEKEKVWFNSELDFGDLFLKYLPKNSVGYKILERTYTNLMTVRYEWKDSIEFIVNPKDEDLMKYFTQKWNESAIDVFFPPKSLKDEFLNTFKALMDITRSIIKSKIFKRLN